MSRNGDYIDLAELQLRIKEGIEDAFPDKLWVKAEISSWSPRVNGHCYLTLSQSHQGRTIAESRAMIWKWNYPQLKSFFEDSTGRALEAGLTVLVKVQVSFSEIYGVSLFIDDIDPAFTLGEQALERKRIIERLEKDGYMEMQKELALPALPRRLAVITSRTAAGYQDFREHLLGNEEGYAFVLELFEALMQGEQAPASIISALLDAQEGDYDAILILRGGGGESDLACFDDENLAVAIATCPLPVITAIGHDKDFHIADMVAMQYVKTPTALADLFLDAFAEQDGMILELERRISRAMRQLVTGEEMKLNAMFARIGRGIERRYEALHRLMDNAVHRLRFAALSRIGREEAEMSLKEARIKASDPRNILSLGYVLVSGKDNKVLKSVGSLSVGDRIGVRFADGSAIAKVDEIYNER